MKKLFFLLPCAIALLSTQACNNGHAKNYNNDVDQNSVLFIKNGIEGGLTEIKAAGLAITNSNNQQVIGLAKTLIDDHTKVDEQLTKLELDKKIVEKDTISSAHEKVLADLSKKTGVMFDKAFLLMIVTDHQEAIKLFTAATKDNETDISKFAKATLPSLKMHLDTANEICIKLK